MLVIVEIYVLWWILKIKLLKFNVYVIILL